MRKTLFFLLLSSSLFGSVFAITMTCPTNSGCDQCFRDTLGSTTSSSDVFVPRAGAKEQIDLATSTISAEALQGAGVTPIGDIKSSYTLDDGPSTTQWPWAVMKGQLIIK